MEKRLLIILSLFVSTILFSQVRINYKEIYKEAAPGVVLLFGTDGKVGSTGTGSIVKEDGTILTNAHVVINPQTHQPYKYLSAFLKPEKVNGKNSNDLKFNNKVNVLSFDEEMDLAVVKMITPPKNLVVIPIADTDSVGIGEATAAIGHPEQGSRWSLTTGAISAEISDFNGTTGKNVFQMETAVNRGNSGGPLLDYRGYLIGINSMIARESKDGLAIVGINFAIKADVAVKWMAEHDVFVGIVKNDGKVDTPVVENKVAVKETSNDVKNEVKEEVKEDTTTKIASSPKLVNKNKNKENDDVKLKLVVHDNKNKHETAKISNRVRVRVVFRRDTSERKYRSRPNKVKVESDFKSGSTLTETQVISLRAKKAHKKLNEKLGSWEDDEVPGWNDDDDTF
jgi:serine protease Do